ncbi:MAG: N-methyl-L-tryptophan oxidase [Planctomycetota bacterium]
MGNKERHFDCIVIGFGGIGSQALRQAAKSGWRVLGLDRFGPAHDRGSSHGHTRIIRRAYFEHPNYVPLACRSFEMWDELNKRHRTSIEIKSIINPLGLLQIGHPDSPVIQGVLQSADQHQLRVETFTPDQIEQRLPIFKINTEHIGLFEADAGYLRVELCVAAAINQAIREGATVQSNTTVQHWEQKTSGQIKVVTDKDSYVTDRLIIATGPWTQNLLPDLNLGIRVIQKQQHWFQIDRVDQKIENQFPAFLLEQEDGSCFYGLPEIDYLGMKVCEHTGGTEISSPDEQTNRLDPIPLERVQRFMEQNLRYGYARMVHHSSCMYTMSDDGHFIVDRHPKMKNVVFAAGMSGHGFKFAPVIGKQLIDLLNGQDSPEFEFLKIRTGAKSF